jgi:hypothetical protein
MGHPADYEFDDRLMASAVRFLIDGQEEDAANVLLSCRLVTNHRYSYYIEIDHYEIEYYDLIFYCPRAAYDILTDQDNPINESIDRAIRATLPPHPTSRQIIFRAEQVQIDANWHSELLEIARGRGVNNQLADEIQARVRTWNNLRFRSQSEVRIAIALDQAGVLFLPNCRARLTTPQGRENREADFLVCHEGKWGILEVDGEPFHPPSRTVHDHERDRLFKSHGIRVVEHFDASECFENAKGVVDRFLDILRQS